jgi:hypothetical protein
MTLNKLQHDRLVTLRTRITNALDYAEEAREAAAQAKTDLEDTLDDLDLLEVEYEPEEFTDDGPHGDGLPD